MRNTIQFKCKNETIRDAEKCFDVTVSENDKGLGQKEYTAEIHFVDDNGTEDVITFEEAKNLLKEKFPDFREDRLTQLEFENCTKYPFVGALPFSDFNNLRVFKANGPGQIFHDPFYLSALSSPVLERAELDSKIFEKNAYDIHLDIRSKALKEIICDGYPVPVKYLNDGWSVLHTVRAVASLGKHGIPITAQNVAIVADYTERKKLNSIDDEIFKNYKELGLDGLEKLAKSSVLALSGSDEMRRIEEKYNGFDFDKAVFDLKFSDAEIGNLHAGILKPGDMRMAILGQATNRGPYLGSGSETTMMYGLVYEHAGFWIIENKDSHKIFAQGVIWEKDPDTLVLDNIEFSDDRDDVSQFTELLGLWAKNSPYKNIYTGSTFYRMKVVIGGRAKLISGCNPPINETVKQIIGRSIHSNATGKQVVIKKDGIVEPYFSKNHDGKLGEHAVESRRPSSVAELRENYPDSVALKYYDELAEMIRSNTFDKSAVKSFLVEKHAELLKEMPKVEIVCKAMDICDSNVTVIYKYKESIQKFQDACRDLKAKQLLESMPFDELKEKSKEYFEFNSYQDFTRNNWDELSETAEGSQNSVISDSEAILKDAYIKDAEVAEPSLVRAAYYLETVGKNFGSEIPQVLIPDPEYPAKLYRQHRKYDTTLELPAEAIAEKMLNEYFHKLRTESSPIIPLEIHLEKKGDELLSFGVPVSVHCSVITRSCGELEHTFSYVFGTDPEWFKEEVVAWANDINPNRILDEASAKYPGSTESQRQEYAQSIVDARKEILTAFDRDGHIREHLGNQLQEGKEAEVSPVNDKDTSQVEDITFEELDEGLQNLLEAAKYEDLCFVGDCLRIPGETEESTQYIPVKGITEEEFVELLSDSASEHQDACVREFAEQIMSARNALMESEERY